MSDDCIFCKIVNKEILSDFLHEDEECVVFKDINPRAPEHFLVVPKAHIPKVSDVKDADEHLLGHLINVARKFAAKQGIEHFRLQFNNGEKGGQEVFHIHLHLLGWR